jgi:peptide-N4-(N-acetyl-beta-glucosaminyl)asparagine amidase
VRFSTVKNAYQCLSGNRLNQEIKNWNDGALSYSNIQYKVENDWKMCYLARTQGSEKAFIEWSFDLSSSDQNSKLNNIELKCKFDCFQSGRVMLTLFSIKDGSENGLILDKSGGNSHFSFYQMGDLFFIKIVEDVKLDGLKLRADLSKGDGDNAWQHTQLFRQSLNDHDLYLFDVCFKFD